MKIVTYNVNGVRAAIKKGLLQWIKTTNADVVCLQEIKADQTSFDFKAFEEIGYSAIINPAQKKGYSGVATLFKTPTEQSELGIGIDKFDNEGRVLQTWHQGIRLFNIYFPSGTTGTERQDYKYEFLDAIFDFIVALLKQNEKLVVVGDYNICHRAIDIHNPVSNKNSSGFLPDERAWMDRFFEAGFIDTFRYLNPNPHHYTWWTYRANARQRNIGWRIDYIAVSQNLKNNIIASEIKPDAVHSDHCPVITQLKLP